MAHIDPLREQDTPIPGDYAAVFGGRADAEQARRVALEQSDVLTVLRSEHGLLMAALWDIYVATGSDPDGDTHWHCTPEDAAKAAVMAVRELREEADDDTELEAVKTERGRAVETRENANKVSARLDRESNALKRENTRLRGELHDARNERDLAVLTLSAFTPADKPLPTLGSDEERTLTSGPAKTTNDQGADAP